MAKSTKKITLNDGAKIPALGLGTWQSSPDQVYNAVSEAIRFGYRHIDTAFAYGNEEPIGKAIRDSGIPRSDIFVTTKLWGTSHRDPQSGLDRSLKKLGLDYVDLYLVHWPVPMNPNGNDPMFPKKPDGSRDLDDTINFVETWARMQKLPTSKAKSIGVSNMSISNLEKLLDADSTTKVPVVNQVELHPYLPQPNLLKFCKEHKIYLEAYSPLGSTNSPLLKNETIVELAKKYDVQPANILISWALWRDTIVLPKSVTSSRIESNFDVVDLSDEDGALINAISKTHTQRFVDPDWGMKVFDDAD